MTTFKKCGLLLRIVMGAKLFWFVFIGPIPVLATWKILSLPRSHTGQTWLILLGSFLTGWFVRSLIRSCKKRKAFLSAFHFIMLIISAGTVLVPLDAMWNHKFLHLITAKVPSIEVDKLPTITLVAVFLGAAFMYLLVKPKKECS